MMLQIRRSCLGLAIVSASLITKCPELLGNDGVPSVIDLTGTWRLALDRDAGAAGKWYEPAATSSYDRSAQLPGSLDSQGIGDPVTLDTQWIGVWSQSGFRDAERYAPYRLPHEIKLPFWLTPETHYVGPAWYRRSVTIPADWKNRRVVLSLERCHWAVTAWFDGKEIGQGDSLSAPNEFLLPNQVEAGEHELVLRIDNRMLVNLGPNSHSVSDQTQGNWNGAVGRIELRATPLIWIEHCRIDPDCREKAAHVTVRIGNLTGKTVGGVLRLTVKLRGDANSKGWTADADYKAPPGGGEVALTCQLGSAAKSWDEHAPEMYDVTAVWTPRHDEVTSSHATTTSFGLREVGTAGTQITLNGTPRFFRGTLDCCVYPLTGHPPMDLDNWRRVIRTCQAHGLNHIRFHSWCPPEAAFAAADELGFYFQVECPSWAGWEGVELGAGQPVDEFLYREAQRILDAYGNHPSFLLFAYGNEPSGNGQSDYLTRWVDHIRKQDDRRLYTSASGWPMLAANQFHVTPQPRIQQGRDHCRLNDNPPETQTDYREFVSEQKVPTIAHEIGQWCAYPNFEEIAKYKGHLKAKNFEIFHDFLDQAGMSDQAQQFLMASGKLQTLCYKEEIESALRTPGIGGFQLLGLSDFSGQGTALVGSLDAFWEAKPYVTAKEYRRFAGPVIPLARLSRRTFVAGDTLAADVDLANFGAEDLQPAVAKWRLFAAASGQLIASGELKAAAPTGKLTRLGSLQVKLPADAVAAKLRLAVAVGDHGNDWDLWVYPAKQSMEAGEILVADELDEATRQHLADGGRVLLTVPKDQVKTDQILGFSPIFWNTLWSQRQAPHTLGILCDPKHPALAAFPTEFHSNWQWWELINGAAALDLTAAELPLKPIVQVVPDWFDPHRLALAVECRVGQGRLLVVSANVTTDQADRPAARQFKSSLLAYMNSGAFDPQKDATIEQVERLFK